MKKLTEDTEDPINSAKLKENIFNVVNLTETINSYVNTTEKLHFTDVDNSVATKVKQALFPEITDTDDIVLTTEELINNKSMMKSFKKTENNESSDTESMAEKNNEYQTQSEKLEDTKICTKCINSSFIQQPDEQIETPVNIMLNADIVETKI